MTEIKGNNQRGYAKYLLVLCLVLATALFGMWLSSSVTLAEGDFDIVESYPKDGANNAAVENLGVKITFSSPINAEANHADNAKCFTLTGPDGNTLPTKVYYNPKDATQLLVLYDTTETGPLTTRTSEHYKVTVSKDLKDNEGNTLGKDVSIEFDTINQSFNTKVYMVIMLLMMAGMAFFTTRQTQKKMAESQAGKGGKEEAFNPYKEAKRTGKSVAEVTAIHEKEVAKAEAKAAKKNVREYDEDDLDDFEIDNGNYKVKGPRPISAGGSTYITGRKALAEAKKEEEERLAQRRAKAKKKK